MSIEVLDDSLRLSAGKRKRDQGADCGSPLPLEVVSEPSTSKSLISPSHCAASLRTTSPDTLRQTLSQLTQATHIDADEDHVPPADKRLVFAREFLRDNQGCNRLFQAWTTIDHMKLPVLQPLPLFAISNLIRLTAYHYTDHELCLSLIRPIVPQGTEESEISTDYWQLITSYMSGNRNSTSIPQQSFKSDETLYLACLQLLTNIVRFQRGRFARSITEHFPWAAKPIGRLSILRRRRGKATNPKAKGEVKAATFSRPDSRISFLSLLTSILHPASLPEYQPDGGDEPIDSGAATSTKLLLLGSDFALPHISSFINSLAEDHTSVAARLLQVLHRSVLRDPKLPRGSLINLVRTSDLLSLLLQTGQKSQHQLDHLTFQILRELCSKAGRGICFTDQGWYGRSMAGPGVSAGQEDSNRFTSASGAGDAPGRTLTSASGIYNPLLDSLIASPHFSPLYNSAHRNLLLQILTAAKELQPTFLSSPRGIFGGGRLEPPSGIHVSAGSSSRTSEGARLSGLLANRLMGQLVDLELPTFRPRRPPVTTRLLAGLLPATLVRSNFMKGIRHHDRLVRWSTLDLLQRILARVLRFLAGCCVFAQREQSWATAFKAVSKEVVKRLPDIATILSCVEGGEGMATGAGPPRVDHLLVEASLKATSLLLEVLSYDVVSTLTLNYDIRKLLPLAAPDEGQSESNKELGVANLTSAIQLHTLKILRLSKAQLLSTSGNSDSKAASAFASLVILSRSARATEDIRKEAVQLLIEVVGAVHGGDDTAATSSLLLEQDQGELEAWLFALPLDEEDIGQDTAVDVIALLEECLTRCSRNTYRYVEAAKKASQSITSDSVEMDHLSVSPLFVTLMEQMTIKFQKDLFPTKQLRSAVLRYLAQLVALLCGRHRLGASPVLCSLVQRFQADAQHNLDVGELWLLQVAQGVVTASDASSYPCEASVSNMAPIHQSTAEFTAKSIDEISITDQRPISSTNLTALLTCLNDRTVNLKPLLLLHPVMENLCSSMEILLLEGRVLYAPPSILLLHSLHQQISESALGKIQLLPESVPLAKLTLRLILTTLTKGAQAAKTLALQALAKVTLSSASPLTSAELGDLFFLNSDLKSALEAGTADLRPLVPIGVQRFDCAIASERACLSGLIEAVVGRLNMYMDLAVTLLPYMHQIQLRQVWSTILSNITTWETEHQILEGTELLRKALRLMSAEHDGIHQDIIFELLTTLCQRCKDRDSQASTAALLCDLLSTEGLDGFEGSDAVLRRPILLTCTARECTFAYTIRTDVPGYDSLQARMIYRLPGAADRFFERLNEVDLVDKLRTMPMSLRALLDVKGLAHASEQQLNTALASLLPRLCLEPTSPTDLIFSDCLGILVEMGKTDEIATQLPPTLDPAEVFKLGLITFGASLAKKADITPEGCKLVQLLLDKGLLWLVRRFAEDDVDKEELLITIQAFTALVHHASVADIARPKSHLAEPVIEAGIKRRLTERRPMELIRALLRYTPLGPSPASALFSTLLAHPHFPAVAKVSPAFTTEGSNTSEAIGRSILVSCSYYLASQHPVQLLTTHNVQSLLAIYGGTLTLSDRLIFNLLEKAEHQRASRVALAPLIRGWSADGSAPSTSRPIALDALLSLHPNRAFGACAVFPRSRTFGHLLVREEVDDDEDSARFARRDADVYDPLWILCLLAAPLGQNNVKITGLQWLAILRTCSVSVAVCALSSKSASVRRMAFCVMQSVYDGIQSADLQERDHILLALDSLRSSLSAPADADAGLSPASSAVPPALPLTTTLFFAHHFRLLATPSSIFYPISSRFLLQRATFDTSDVPMLYNMLQSTDAEHWRVHRLWILRFLRDTLLAGGATLEWRVMKRRYVWDLLASVYTESKHALRRIVDEGDIVETSIAGTGAVGHSGGSSSAISALKQSLALIEEVMLAAVSLPDVAIELLSRKDLLGWLSQQVTLESLSRSSTSVDLSGTTDAEAESVQDASIWLILLQRALRGDILDKLDRSTAGSWTSSTLDVLEAIRFSSAQDLKRATETVASIVKHLQTQAIRGEAEVSEDLPWITRRLTSYVNRLASSVGSPTSMEQAVALLEVCSRLETLSTSFKAAADEVQLDELKGTRGRLLTLVLGKAKQVVSEKSSEQRETLRRQEVRSLLGIVDAQAK